MISVRFLILVQCVYLTSASFVHLTPNGYQNVIVAFDEIYSLNVANCSVYINSIQEVFSAASDALCTATDSSASFGTVYIVAPKSWTESCGTVEDHPWLRSHHADFVIGMYNPVSGSMPITYQYGGCGDSALPIILPGGFLTTNTSSRKGEILLHEWMHYRYGVFDEAGFQGDQLFPAVYNIQGKDYEPNSCTNEPMVGQLSASSCSSSNVATCDWSALPEDNQHIESSLMYRTDFPNMKKLCTGTTHNRYAANKQNWFCDGKSVRDIVAGHRDFREGFNVTCSKPTFHVVPKPDARFLFILDTSSSMAVQGRFEGTTEALAEFVWFLNDGDMVSLVTFDDDAVIQQNPIAVSTTIKKNILQMMRRLSPRGSAAGFGKALNLGLTLASSGAEVVILTAVNEMFIPLNFSDIVSSYRNQKTSVRLLTFGNEAFDSLNQLAMFGSMAFVPDWSALESSLTGPTALTIAVGHLQNIYSQVGKQRAKIFETRHHIQDGGSISGSIYVDSTAPRLIISFSSPDAINVRLYNETHQLVVIPIQNSWLWTPSTIIQGTLQQQRWNYTIDAFFGAAAVNVDAWVEGTELPTTIKAKTWTSAVDNGAVDVITEPVVLYTQVLLYDNPVLGANVVAKIYSLTQTGNVELISVLKLEDGGPAGNTMGDGIYSAYVTTYSNVSTKHTVMVEVTDNSTSRTYFAYQTYKHYTAASSIVGETLTALLPFRRHLYGADFLLGALTPSGDFLPPIRIQDLRLFSVLSDDGYYDITLMWTSPADDLGSGPLVSNFTVVMEVEAGGRAELYSGYIRQDDDDFVRFYWGIPSYFVGTTIFYVQGVDSSGNRGSLSNPAIIHTPDTQDDFNYGLLWGLVGAGIGIVVILLIILVVYIWKKKKNRRNRPKNQTSQRNSGHQRLGNTDARAYGGHENRGSAGDLSNSEDENEPRGSYDNRSFEHQETREVDDPAARRIDPQLAAILRDNRSRLDLSNIDAESDTGSSHYSNRSEIVYTIPVKTPLSRPSPREMYANNSLHYTYTDQDYPLQDRRLKGPGVTSLETTAPRTVARNVYPSRPASTAGSLV